MAELLASLLLPPLMVLLIADAVSGIVYRRRIARTLDGRSLTTSAEQVFQAAKASDSSAEMLARLAREHSGPWGPRP